MGEQGVGRQKSLNLNLKGGKLIKLWNQGVEMQKSVSLNFIASKWTKMGKRVRGGLFIQIFIKIIDILLR